MKRGLRISTNNAAEQKTNSFLKTPAMEVQEVDWIVLWVPVLLLLAGLVMVYSASIALPDSSKFKNYSHYHFFIRHLMSLAVGFVAAFIGFRIPTKIWEKLAPIVFLLAMFLLILVLVPGIGKGVNGARRWLPLGFMNLQPSEIMKIAAALYAASFCVRKQQDIKNIGRGVLPMLVVIGFIGLFLMLEPDMGAFMVVVAITMGVIFLGGVNYKVFAALVGVLVAGFTAMVVFTPWRAARLFAYLDPWTKDNAEGKAYQLTQSLIAFGRGELFGVGLGDSVQKMFYLPEAHTDFILAVIGEEFGLLGVWVVILAFTILVRRMFSIAREAMAFERIFQALAVQGFAIWFGVQGFINMGVNMGILPTKGLTLPFVSYGGSAILASCLAVAFVLRVDYENRRLMRGEQV